MKPPKWDINDPKNMGRPLWFDLDAFLLTVEGYITADEVSTAFYLLDNMPGWYRDNVPIECVMLRDQLHRKFFTSLEYAKDGCTIEKVVLQPHEQLKAAAGLERGWLTLETVRSLKCPWVYELGPGNYWIPFMLRAHARDSLGKEGEFGFTYCGPSLNSGMQEDAAAELKGLWKLSPNPDRAKVFICFEMLEHLARTEEIYQHYVKAGGDFDVILLSTPKYTYGGGMPNWFESDLGHLRTYTPNEFTQFARKHWPMHDWAYYDGPVMMLKGTKNDSQRADCKS